MGSEDIAKLCANLTLLETEGQLICLRDGLKAAGLKRLALSLVGKVLTNKLVNYEFKSMEDRRRILAGGPWTFGGALIILEEPTGKGDIEKMSFSTTEFWVQTHRVSLLCITKEIGHFLGGMVGVVMDMDVGTLGDCSGEFLRVRVTVDIAKPLRGCLRVDVLGDGEETMMLLRYERLPTHCFWCGRLGHSTSECMDKSITREGTGSIVEAVGLGLNLIKPKSKGKLGKAILGKHNKTPRLNGLTRVGPTKLCNPADKEVGSFGTKWGGVHEFGKDLISRDSVGAKLGEKLGVRSGSRGWSRVPRKNNTGVSSQNSLVSLGKRSSTTYADCAAVQQKRNKVIQCDDENSLSGIEVQVEGDVEIH
ncbi:hypothetical protein Dsin_005645 [Dipteronia sinensis]|uniref:CCHC-type domain-containing protein n=1 Tax=Dipteronia sinensis TaxID=43782 RepID=A0AAE0AXP7_9ROSI|nr:hypothetical protein Dsin_005645 [Dipteronia sinensis]